MNLAETLNRYIELREIGDAKLARLTNETVGEDDFEIHRSNIRNWRQGTSKTIRDWRQLVAVAYVLNIDKIDVEKLLAETSHPNLVAIHRNASPRFQELIAPWLEHPSKHSSLDAEQIVVSEMLDVVKEKEGVSAEDIKPSPPTKRRLTLPQLAIGCILLLAGFLFYFIPRTNQASTQETVASAFKSELTEQAYWASSECDHIDIQAHDEGLQLSRFATEGDTGCWSSTYFDELKTFMIDVEVEIDGRAAILTFGGSEMNHYWVALVPEEKKLGVQRVTNNGKDWSAIGDYAGNIINNEGRIALQIWRTPDTLELRSGSLIIPLEAQWLDEQVFEVGMGISVHGEVDTQVLFHKFTVFHSSGSE